MALQKKAVWLILHRLWVKKHDFVAIVTGWCKWFIKRRGVAGQKSFFQSVLRAQQNTACIAEVISRSYKKPLWILQVTEKCTLNIVCCVQILNALNSAPLQGGFFLAPVEGCSLRLQQKGPSDPNVLLPDGRMDNDFMGVRSELNAVFGQLYSTILQKQFKETQRKRAGVCLFCNHKKQ